MTKKEYKKFIKNANLIQYTEEMSVMEFCDRGGFHLTPQQYDYLKAGASCYGTALGIVYIVLLDRLLGKR